MTALVLDRVVKRFGDFTAVDSLSFSVPDGGVFGFLGGNGAGKTTSVRMMLDILRPDAGHSANALIERLGLSQWARTALDKLSKGMSQKVQLATALVNHPRLLILDEPFSGLAPVNQGVLEEIVLEP